MLLAPPGAWCRALAARAAWPRVWGVFDKIETRSFCVLSALCILHVQSQTFDRVKRKA